MNVALYCRVSSEEQRDRQSIRTQIEFGEQWGKLRGEAFSETFLDDGVSGTIPLEKRPGGLALLKAARAGRISTVYVYRLDRLGRDVRLIHNAVHQLEATGCALVSMTESFETVTPSGKAMLGMLAVFASFEKDSIAERVSHGKDRVSRIHAKFMGGPRPPYGYRRTGKGSEAFIEPDPEESAIVRLIYALMLDGWSSLKIADHLNSLAVPTSTVQLATPHWKNGKLPSGKWHGAMISRLIRSTTYKGLRYHNKRSRKKRPLQEQTCPALVSEDTWDRAQTALSRLRNPRTRPGERIYMLRGLLVCSLCGRKLYGWPGPRDNFYYVCHGRHSSQTGPKCALKYLAIRTAEPYVWAEIEARIKAADLPDNATVRKKEREAVRTRERRVLEQRITGKVSERERILRLFRQGAITDADVSQQLAEIEKEQLALNARWEALVEIPDPAPAVDRKAVLADVKRLLRDTSATGRQGVAALVIERIDVAPDLTLSIHWRV